MFLRGHAREVSRLIRNALNTNTGVHRGISEIRLVGDVRITLNEFTIYYENNRLWFPLIQRWLIKRAVKRYLLERASESLKNVNKRT